jgi:hypothetical protein
MLSSSLKRAKEGSVSSSKRDKVTSLVVGLASFLMVIVVTAGMFIYIGTGGLSDKIESLVRWSFIGSVAYALVYVMLAWYFVEEYRQNLASRVIGGGLGSLSLTLAVWFWSGGTVLLVYPTLILSGLVVGALCQDVKIRVQSKVSG